MSRSKLQNKAWTLDSSPQFVFSGEIQQYRLPPSEWRDRFEKLAALGLNCVGVYAGWNFHSPEIGVYDFESPDKDFGRFLDEAARVGIKVLVRPGPYVCNEWDLGGYPGWLLSQGPDDWRTGDAAHLEHCIEWYRQINQVVAPRQIDNGGPVILYQLENEHWWGDKDLFEALAKAARNQGITVPFIGNGGGSAKRCGADVLVDGCDIYTNVYENWRWRGWLELAARLAGDAPLMVVEYNAASFAAWGGRPGGEHSLPSEWFMSLTRMFMGLGANFLNPFVAAGGITPVNFGSDHCCTAYSEDAAVAHWGGLGQKFYLLRLLTEIVSSLNAAFVGSKPTRDFWATDSGYVEGMLREGPLGKFVVAVNSSTHTEEFRLLLPDGRHFPESGTICIEPRVSQFHVIDIPCADGVVLEYSTAQVMKIWREKSTINIVVYGKAGSAGHLIFLVRGSRVRVDFCCEDSVCVKRIANANGAIKVFAVSTEVAKRTWFVRRKGSKISALFSNLDLVRPQLCDEQIHAEIESGTALRLVTDRISLSAANGPEILSRVRPDGMIEHFVGDAGIAHVVDVTLGKPTYRAEDTNWTAQMPSKGNGWIEVDACRPGREVITNPGVYQYVQEFHCDKRLPEFLEFLGISSAETVVYLNGRRVAVFPEQRRATFHEMDDYRLRIPVGSAVREGTNILALVLTVIGRHNCGNALFAGISHPILLYSERDESPLADWEFVDFGGRRHMAKELDCPSAEFFAEIASRRRMQMDLAHPPALRETELSDWLDVRCLHRDVEIPERMKGRPLFLECGKMDDAWCFVNGKMAGRAYHQMSATFDLTQFSSDDILSVTIVGRFYWQGKCLPSIIPTLVTADTVLPHTFLRRNGADGERGRYYQTNGEFELSVQPSDAPALWVHYLVGVSISTSVVAPIYVELDERWAANAVIYWNGSAIGRYSVVGPDRRFFVNSGLIQARNHLVVHVDGYGAQAVAGGVTVGPYAQYRQLVLDAQDSF